MEADDGPGQRVRGRCGEACLWALGGCEEGLLEEEVEEADSEHEYAADETERIVSDEFK